MIDELLKLKKKIIVYCKNKKFVELFKFIENSFFVQYVYSENDEINLFKNGCLFVQPQFLTKIT